MDLPLSLALVPLETVVEEGATVRRPRLPVSVYDRPQGWGQASSAFEPEGKALIWLRASDAECEAIMAQSRSAVLRTLADAAEAAELLEALRTSATARAEFVSCYRGAAEAEEAALAAQAGRARLAAIVAAAVAAIGFAAVLAAWPGAALYLGLVPLHQDTFDRAASALNGSTMSDGLGAWTADAGLVVSGDALSVDTVNRYGHDSAMAATGTMRVTMRAVSNRGGGPIARFGAGPNGYIVFRRQVAGNPIRLSRLDAGVQTILGTGSNTANGDTFGVDADGASISGLLNGGVDIAPATDSTYATGVAGVGRVGTENVVLDDFLVEVAEGQPMSLRRGGVSGMRAGLRFGPGIGR